MTNGMVVPAAEQSRAAYKAQSALSVERVLRAVVRLQRAITQAAERGQLELQEALPEFADDMGMQMAVFAHFRSAGHAGTAVSLNPPTIHSANRIADSDHSHALCCQSVESVTASAVEVRDKAVEAWMAANPEQALMAERHVRSCQFSLSARNRDSDEGDTRMTFTECLEQAGAVSLAPSVQQAVEQVHRPLPLRMFSSS